MHIGIAGTGRMGTNIGERLIELGHKLTVWNRSPGKLKPLLDAGALSANTPAGLAGAVECIITILTDAPAIEAVYLGPRSARRDEARHSSDETVPPEVSVALERSPAGRAPLRRMPGRRLNVARAAGKLLSLIGGEAADVARARPVIDQMCRRALWRPGWPWRDPEVHRETC